MRWPQHDLRNVEAVADKIMRQTEDKEDMIDAV
jgi:hypothetical protein